MATPPFPHTHTRSPMITIPLFLLSPSTPRRKRRKMMRGSVGAWAAQVGAGCCIHLLQTTFWAWMVEPARPIV